MMKAVGSKGLSRTHEAVHRVPRSFRREKCLFLVSVIATLFLPPNCYGSIILSIFIYIYVTPAAKILETVDVLSDIVIYIYKIPFCHLLLYCCCYNDDIVRGDIYHRQVTVGMGDVCTHFIFLRSKGAHLTLLLSGAQSESSRSLIKEVVWLRINDNSNNINDYIYSQIFFFYNYFVPLGSMILKPPVT